MLVAILWYSGITMLNRYDLMVNSPLPKGCANTKIKIVHELKSYVIDNINYK